MAGQPWCGTAPKILSLVAHFSSQPYMTSSGLGTWWVLEAGPGLGWLQCQCPLLFSKTGCAPTKPGPSSPMARVPAQPITAMLRCSPFPSTSPQSPGTALSQRVQR